MYADDTTVYCIGDNGDVAVSLFNRAVRVVSHKQAQTTPYKMRGYTHD